MDKTGGDEAGHVCECWHSVRGVERGVRSRGVKFLQSECVESSEAFEPQTNARAGVVIDVGGEAVDESDRALIRVGAVEAVAAAPERAAASKRASGMVGRIR